jgi:hypothetical protein
MVKEEARKCIECGEPLKGRADKKFCDDQCRSAYNNRLNSDSYAEMRNINNILRKNRRIMESFAQKEGKGFVSKEKLIEAGFSFKYFTHTYLTKKGVTYRICYDYGYLPVENNMVMIVKWGKEMTT